MNLYLNNIGDDLRHSFTLLFQELSALLLLGWGSDDRALVLLLNLALGGVDGVVLDDGVDLALLVRDVMTLPFNHRLLLDLVGDTCGVDTLEYLQVTR